MLLNAPVHIHADAALVAVAEELEAVQKLLLGPQAFQLDGARVALPPSGALGWTTRRSLVSKFVGEPTNLIRAAMQPCHAMQPLFAHL